MSFEFGAFSFHAHQHSPDECDSKGLPLTPNSILITGSYQDFKDTCHPNLCSYLDLIKYGDDERLICVSEYYPNKLEDHIKSKQFRNVSELTRLSYQILDGLRYLHERNIIVRNLSPDNILFSNEGHVKLFNYGLYHMTYSGNAVEFPIGSPRYLAPEVLLSMFNSKQETVAMTTKSDIWAFGIIILELLMEFHLYPDLFLKNGLTTLFTRILRILQNEQRMSIPPVIGLLEMHGCDQKLKDHQLIPLLELCVSCLPSSRYTAQELLQTPLLLSANNNKLNNIEITRSPFQDNGFQCSHLQIPSVPHPPSSITQAQTILNEDHLENWNIKEVYYLWCLAGGDVHNELIKMGLINSKPPILTLPHLVSKDGEEFGMERNRVHLYDGTVVQLSLEQLKTRLETMNIEDYYPVLTDPSVLKNKRKSILSRSKTLMESAKLPLMIKEKDIDYQFHRLVLYRTLLEGYPYTQDVIITESIIDICPFFRGEIWAALLNIRGDISSLYTNIDKDSETHTDRQIAVDIPRCHQYDLLLASKQGHQKFMRLLKAWVVAHPDLVYWQGLDSLCASFLALNFNNEGLAYSCLCAFIEKYLHNFFCKDNSEVMQEYLAVFSHMIAYHDPELFNHLDTNGFTPDLYAIPWFLTMFTHVFPLNKIYHLWDTLLLGNSSFPIFAGLSILTQLRSELFSFDFSECIMMFSDLPDIDIQQCISEAVHKYQITPPSLCVRKHEKISSQNSLIPQEAKKEFIPYKTLRDQCSPQISAHDLIVLCKLERSSFCYANKAPPPKNDINNPLLWRKVHDKEEKKHEAIVLDIRSEEEYRTGHVPHSINLPHTDAFSSNGSLVDNPVVTSLMEQHYGKIIIVVANTNDPGPTFTRHLVRLNFPHVCLLQGGAGILRSLGLLSAL